MPNQILNNKCIVGEYFSACNLQSPKLKIFSRPVFLNQILIFYKLLDGSKSSRPNQENKVFCQKSL